MVLTVEVAWKYFENIWISAICGAEFKVMDRKKIDLVICSYRQWLFAVTVLLKIYLCNIYWIQARIIAPVMYAMFQLSFFWLAVFAHYVLLI